MDEIQLLRGQIAGERQRTGSVAAALQRKLRLNALDDGAAPWIAYLSAALASFAARDKRLAALLQQWPPGRGGADTLRAALAQPPGSGQLRKRFTPLAALPLTGADNCATWNDLLEQIAGAWQQRGAQLESGLAAHARVMEWRAWSGIDADSIMAERERYRALGGEPQG
ncbi:MAG: hypothetical protein JSR67_03035 [Proteobacteria bacterium]|nr:hypothetical protein [Pseudomonadota bacterium]